MTSCRDVASDGGSSHRVWPHEPSTEAFVHRDKRIASQLRDPVRIRLPKPLLSASLCALEFAVGGYADDTHTPFEGTNVTRVTL